MATILLIDDDEDVRNMTAELLLSAGHAVDTADDGKTGLALYKTKQYDLVITDIVMGEMDGLQLIDQLRQTDPRPRVIAISGGHQFSRPVYLPTAKRLGLSESSPSRSCPTYCCKPWPMCSPNRIQPQCAVPLARMDPQPETGPNPDPKAHLIDISRRQTADQRQTLRSR